MTGPAGRPAAVHRAGILLLLAAAVLWSLNGLLIKTLQAGGVGGCSIAAFRSVIAAAALAPIALHRWKPIPEKRWLAATVLAFTGMCASFVIATTMTTAANAIILQYTAPAWVFVFSPLIVGESAVARQWLALAGAMIGVVIIFGWELSTDMAGLLVALTSGLIFGMQSVLFRRVRALDPVVLAFVCCAGSALVLLVPALAVDAAVPRGTNLALLVLMGIVQFALPYVLYSAAIARVTAQAAILIVMLEPVLNPVWVWLGRGEVPSVGTILGGAVILASVTYLALSRRGESRQPPAA
ncbi:MAG TPA: DMT family transporter [Phycisphaerae bacterium]|nr:DMT family transporter [Phycisphaerae bacterium]